MNQFSSIANQMASDLSEKGSSQESDSSQENNTQTAEQAHAEKVEQAIQELEKLERFKFDGQEWTPKDLKGAILRQKDYTQKTQTLSTDRKNFEQEQKFYENLAWDLQKLKSNPQLIQEFISIYPEKFHKYAEDILKEATGEQGKTPAPQQPQVPVQLLSRLERMEKHLNDQETKKNELEIQQTMSELSKKYPGTDTDRSKKAVLAEAFDRHSAGTKLTTEVWEDIYKQVHAERDAEFKAEYSEKVKKQQAANAKGRDVGSGGGTAGTAPPKFKKLSDVTNFAIKDLTGRGS